MATIKWAAPNTAETVMTTELNSLASDGAAITATAISNDAAGELYMFATIQLHVAAQGSARSAGASTWRAR